MMGMNRGGGGGGSFSQGNSEGCGEDDLYMELWKACAGPLVDVPKRGERVFYFLQGHMEQLEASTNQELNQRVPLFNLPSKILCCVIHIQLLITLMSLSIPWILEPSKRNSLMELMAVWNYSRKMFSEYARSIQELAKKNFENLRQDSDDNEREPKVVRRGGHLLRILKNHRAGFQWTLLVPSSPQVQLSLQVERINLQRSLVFQICQDNLMVPAMKLMCRLTTDLRRMMKLQVLYLKGSILRSIRHLMRTGVTHISNYHPSAGGRVPSVLNTFDAERKQLVAAGLLTEHGYASSKARFAANIEPFSWTIEAKRIEKSLAPGVKFGPGWVGENEIPPHKSLFSSPLPSQLAPPPQKAFSVLESSAAVATTCSVKSKQEKLSTKPEKDIFPEKQLPSTRLSDARSSPVSPFTAMTTSVSAVNKSEPFTERAESVPKLNSNSAFNVLNSIAGVIRQRAPFQLHQNSATHPGMIGFNATCGFNLAAQMGKLIGVARPAGLGIQSSQMANEVSRTNSNLVRSANANFINSQKIKFPENSSSIKISGALPNPGREALEAPRSIDQAQPTWQGLYPNPRPDSGSSSHQKMDAVRLT